MARSVQRIKVGRIQNEGKKMIVYDEQGDVKLLETLESFKAQPDKTLRCIHFRLSQIILNGSFDKAQQAIINSAKQQLEGDKQQIFLCEDGDIFVVAPEISPKAVNFIALEVLSAYNLPGNKGFFKFIELGTHLNPTLITVQEKIDRIIKKQDTKNQQEKQKEFEKKRHGILNVDVDGATTSLIQKNRQGRFKKEIMVIEDDAFTRKLVENVFSKSHNITGLGDTVAALETYIKCAPDILFLDINLPNVSGHELLEQIMKIDPQAHVIMLSGNSDRENILQAVQKGAKGFVGKPFTAQQLLKHVEDYITKKGA